MKSLNISILTGICLFLVHLSMAQRPASSLVYGADAGIAFNNKGLTVSYHYYEFVKVKRKDIFQVGWGLRASQFVSNNLDYTSAPARFAKSLATTDTLQMSKSTVTSLNFNVAAQISLLNKIDIGASIDLLGLATGGKRTGFHLGSAGFTTDSLNIHKTNQIAKPTTTAIQLFGNSTHGNLNAEIYARVRFTRTMGLKVAYIFCTNEYKTTNPMVEGNQRFRARSEMIYIGLNFLIAN